MKARLLIIIGAIILTSNVALGQYSDVIIPENNKAAADINNTTSAITENYVNQSDLIINSKNDVNLFSSSMSLGTSLVASKYVSVYNIPIGYSFKSKLFFRNNAEAYENLSFKVIIPYVQKKLDVPTFDGETMLKTSGIGDVIIKANYNLYINKMFLSFGLQAKLPNGKVNNDVEGLNIPLGTGSTDINASLLFSKNVSKKISIHSSLGFDFRTKYKSDESEVKYGNKVNFLLGGDFLVKMVKVGADISYSSIANTKVTPSIPMIGEMEMPGISIIDALPYVKVSISEKMDAKLFGVIPLSAKWKSVNGFSPEDPDRKVRIGFSFVYKLERAGEKK